MFVRYQIEILFNIFAFLPSSLGFKETNFVIIIISQWTLERKCSFGYQIEILFNINIFAFYPHLKASKRHIL